MTMSTSESIVIILTVIAGTMLTRFLPFIIFPSAKTPPEYIQYLGKVLPFAVIGMLVIYCLKNVPFANDGTGIAQLVGVLSIIAMHGWKKNSLLSMATGTTVYMLLIQMVL